MGPHCQLIPSLFFIEKIGILNIENLHHKNQLIHKFHAWFLGAKELLVLMLILFDAHSKSMAFCSINFMKFEMLKEWKIWDESNDWRNIYCISCVCWKEQEIQLLDYVLSIIIRLYIPFRIIKNTVISWSRRITVLRTVLILRSSYN